MLIKHNKHILLCTSNTILKYIIRVLVVQELSGWGFKGMSMLFIKLKEIAKPPFLYQLAFPKGKYKLRTN